MFLQGQRIFGNVIVTGRGLHLRAETCECFQSESQAKTLCNFMHALARLGSWTYSFALLFALSKGGKESFPGYFLNG